MLKRAFFITGTDTGVGKTVTTACLIKTLQNQGFVVAVAKPFESGGNRDGAWLKQLTGQPDAWDRWAFPYKFKAPMAPAMAAPREGVRISVKKVIVGLQQLEKRVDVLLVEGAGGVLVPIRKKYMMADLMAELGYPVIIVARPALGTINHSLLTLEALRRRGCKVEGIIFNRCQPGRVSVVEKQNPMVIATLGRIKVLGTLPYIKEIGRQKTNPRNTKYALK